MLQLLANRGYAVLRVEFRGAAGFGKRILNAGRREWGYKMQDDLLDAADWAVREGITTRDREGIWGWSYGGYATLRAMTAHPDRFTCGISLYGASDLSTLPAQWSDHPADDQVYRDRVGDLRTPYGIAFLEASSPLYSAARLDRPLLIATGAKDLIVARQQSDDFVKAARKSRLQVTYLLYPDEGHDLEASPESWISFFAVAEQFLHQQLGGRSEPIGDDLNHANLQILEGAQHIAGLTRTLAERPIGH